MNIDRILLGAGLWLLSVSALAGFVQHAYVAQPERFAAWRVVHVGGTAGAVQLLALAAVLPRLAGGLSVAVVGALTLGLALSTWAFFIGPLFRALGRPRVASVVNGVGAVIAAPAYLALPLVFLS